MKKLTIYVSAIFMSGCAISSDMYLADGARGYSVSCNGSANSVSNCFQKAGEICGAKGYTLLNREGEANQYGLTTASANQSQGALVSQHGMIVTRSIMIKCKE